MNHKRPESAKLRHEIAVSEYLVVRDGVDATAFGLREDNRAGRRDGPPRVVVYYIINNSHVIDLVSTNARTRTLVHMVILYGDIVGQPWRKLSATWGQNAALGSIKGTILRKLGSKYGSWAVLGAKMT